MQAINLLKINCTHFYLQMMTATAYFSQGVITYELDECDIANAD